MFIRMGLVPLRVVIIIAILGGLVLSDSECQPKGPGGGPHNLTPPEWQELFDQGDYDEIVEKTSLVIQEGPEAEFYAEARLYRAMAELGRSGDPEAARDDLVAAERLVDQLTTVDAIMEQVLLYRGQMVANARLGNTDVAERYRDQAIELAPDQEKAIREEFKRAIEE